MSGVTDIALRLFWAGAVAAVSAFAGLVVESASKSFASASAGASKLSLGRICIVH